jgi:heme/copper-type cytochrome/quinol oxidase subunit 3
VSVAAGARPNEPALPIHPVGVEKGRAPGWWGMVMLIFTEATLFAILLTSYFYLRFQSGPVWPPDGIRKPDLGLILVMTPILLGSSLPVHWAGVGIRKGRQWQLRLGLLLTTLMGGTFLGLQAVEYATKLKEFTPRTDVYGSLFYTITGFHGAHVAVGLLLLIWLQVKAWRGGFTPDRRLAVEVITMYWHFVDAVWVFILTALYLSPHFWP